MVPKGWSHTTFEKHIDCLTGYAFSSTEYSAEEHDIRLLRGDNIEPGKLRWINTKRWPRNVQENMDKYFLLEGDFVIALDRTWISGGLKVAEVTCDDLPCLLVQRVARIRAKKTLAQGLLRQYFSGYKFERYVKLTQTATAVPHISPNDIKQFSLLLPPIAEQKKIAQILSTWDKAISVTEKLLANSQQQKKALMQQLLTGKKRLLDENGVRFSGDWGKFTLSHFGKCIRGVSYKPENICENESDNTIRLLRSTNIQNGELNDKDLIILPKKLVKPMQVLMDGDLAICMANGSKSLVGKSAPYKPNDADYTVGAFCALFRPLKSVSSSFVKFLFESNQYQSQLLVILAGSSINNLKGSDIESINIDAPLHYKEQQKIASVLSAADTEISTLEKKLACLKDEKKALMQQLLTGKRRVKVDEAVAV